MSKATLHFNIKNDLGLKHLVPLLPTSARELIVDHRDSVKEVLELLYPDFRVCLILKYGFSMNPSEIAAFLRISEQLIQQRTEKAEEMFRHVAQKWRNHQVSKVHMRQVSKPTHLPNKTHPYRRLPAHLRRIQTYLVVYFTWGVTYRLSASATAALLSISEKYVSLIRHQHGSQLPPGPTGSPKQRCSGYYEDIRCEGTATSHGLCSTHNKRRIRGTDPNAPRRQKSTGYCPQLVERNGFLVLCNEPTNQYHRLCKPHEDRKYKGQVMEIPIGEVSRKKRRTKKIRRCRQIVIDNLRERKCGKKTDFWHRICKQHQYRKRHELPMYIPIGQLPPTLKKKTKTISTCQVLVTEQSQWRRCGRETQRQRRKCFAHIKRQTRGKLMYLPIGQARKAG